MSAPYVTNYGQCAKDAVSHLYPRTEELAKEVKARDAP